jgi:hypothetical protein
MTTISIIGSGNMATAFGTRAARRGHTVELISRDSAKAQVLADQIGHGATVGAFGATPAGDISHWPTSMPTVGRNCPSVVPHCCSTAGRWPCGPATVAMAWRPRSASDRRSRFSTSTSRTAACCTPSTPTPTSAPIPPSLTASGKACPKPNDNRIATATEFLWSSASARSWLRAATRPQPHPSPLANSAKARAAPSSQSNTEAAKPDDAEGWRLRPPPSAIQR